MLKSKVPAFTMPKKEAKVKVSLEGIVGGRVKASNYTGNGHWHADWLMGGADKVGFVYIIRNNLTGRCYIGKKSYRGSGKLNKGTKSNWAWYISSSVDLSADIKLIGKDNFEFICLEEYSYKGSLSWAETWSICYVEAPSNQHMWYNRQVNQVGWIVKEPVTIRHKENLAALIRRYLDEKSS
jgi:hypothetical protein